MVILRQLILHHNSVVINIMGVQSSRLDEYGDNATQLNFVKPACGKARHSCYYVAKVYVPACVHPDLSRP